MIKVKIGPHGGYVSGDGPCPFNEDEFMCLFMDKIIEMQRLGLTELGFSDDEITEMKAKNKEKFMTAPVRMVENTKEVLQLED